MSAKAFERYLKDRVGNEAAERVFGHHWAFAGEMGSKHLFFSAADLIDPQNLIRTAIYVPYDESKPGCKFVLGDYLRSGEFVQSEGFDASMFGPKLSILRRWRNKDLAAKMDRYGDFVKGANNSLNAEMQKIPITFLPIYVDSVPGFCFRDTYEVLKTEKVHLTESGELRDFWRELTLEGAYVLRADAVVVDSVMPGSERIAAIVKVKKKI